MPGRVPKSGGRKASASRGRSWSRADGLLVERLANAGATNEQIAAALGCSVATLKRRFAAVLAAAARAKGPAPVEVSAEQRQVIEAMVGFGFTQEQICTVLGVSLPTLRAACPQELEAGEAKANYQVVRSLFQMATGSGGVDPVPSAAIFWTKARLGWRDRVELHGRLGVDHSGAVSVEANVTVRDAVSRLSPESRSALRRVLADLGASSALDGGRAIPAG